MKLYFQHPTNTYSARPYFQNGSFGDTMTSNVTKSQSQIEPELDHKESIRQPIKKWYRRSPSTIGNITAHKETTNATEIEAQTTPAPAQDPEKYNTVDECIADITRLDSCIWNTWAKCKGQKFLPLGPLWFQTYCYTSYRSIFSPHRAMHEEWLNFTFPWIWIKENVVHYEGDFPEGSTRNRGEFKGLYQSHMYVQKLPTVEELKSIPKGDFDKIDKCVARRILLSLNDSEWEGHGASPRCKLWQVDISFVSTWRYDCTGILKYNSTKELLQGWVEGHSRDKTRTWWGFQREEMEHWVIPCLSQFDNYWVKYQYIAMVYSKEHDIRSSIIYRPDRYVSPRPWKVTYIKSGNTCTVSLARRSCSELPGWESYCGSFYANEYHTHQAATVW
ncbi:uncharacterized protein LOC106521541, partial [Austrofundulus limnaeus]|uniref:Uncharacterized protein LOC106521541 n=1 Tax=Austrofundulus limnaeus TaxID=52670 RepID=A0A2I4BPE4_AUSLI